MLLEWVLPSWGTGFADFWAALIHSPMLCFLAKIPFMVNKPPATIQTRYWDGAMGTELLRHAPQPVELSELVYWPLSHPEAVQNVHRQYLGAGAQGLTTHTFCANRAYLAGQSQPEQTPALNQQAVQLARQCASEVPFFCPVAGSIGPLSPQVSEAEQTAIFQEQAAILLQAGVDLLLLETQLSLSQVLLAIKACQQAMRSRSDVPLIVNFCLNDHALLADGVTLAAACQALRHTGIAALGLNCMNGPASMSHSLQALATYTDWPVWARPSAGLPSPTDVGQWHYPVTPTDFAATLHGLAGSLAVIGGCCGTTPAHIQALC